MAERQGRFLADFLNKGSPKDMEPFRFQSMGMLAYIGRYEALADTPVARLQGQWCVHYLCMRKEWLCSLDR